MMNLTLNLFTDALKAGDLNATGFDNPLTALEYISENHLTICLVVTDWKMQKIHLSLARWDL
jgi:DNA-binding NtrC family response regulator